VTIANNLAAIAIVNVSEEVIFVLDITMVARFPVFKTFPPDDAFARYITMFHDFFQTEWIRIN
jgi:hypothetical protein